MSDIEQYKPQVSPQMPGGVSPLSLIAGFHPPDTQVQDAIAGGVDQLGSRLADIAFKIQASDQTAEVARAQADYFSKMKDWTRGLAQSDLDPTEYRSEFDRQANETAGEISKGLRYGDSHDQFSTWRTGQDVSLLGETLQQQLTVMNDRFGATMLKSLEILHANPDYLPTMLSQINDAEKRGAVDHTAAEQGRQAATNDAQIGQARIEGQKIGWAAMSQKFADHPEAYPLLDANERTALVAELQLNDRVQQQAFQEEDDKLKAQHMDIILKAKSYKDLQAGLQKLTDQQAHSGDVSRQIQGWYADGMRAAVGGDWDSQTPDPAVLSSYFTILTALNNPGARLPNDPARYGAMAGRAATAPEVAIWMDARMGQLGSSYEGERAKLATWQSDVATQAVSRLYALKDSDIFKKKFGSDSAKFLQTTGQWETQLRDNINKYNWTEQQAMDFLTGKVMNSLDKPITEDVPATAQGAQLSLALWNRQYPAWKDKGQVQSQVQALGLAQRTDLAKYFGRDATKIPELSAPPTRPGQEGYLTGDNGVTLFYLNDGKGDTQTYAYVPKSYDPKKPVGQQTYTGDLKVMQLSGGVWKDLPLPKVSQGGSIAAPDFVKMDRNTMVNRRNAIVGDIAKTQKAIQANTAALPNNLMLKTTIDQQNYQLKVLQVDLANIESVMKERGFAR